MACYSHFRVINRSPKAPGQSLCHAVAAWQQFPGGYCAGAASTPLSPYPEAQGNQAGRRRTRNIAASSAAPMRRTPPPIGPLVGGNGPSPPWPCRTSNAAPPSSLGQRSAATPLLLSGRRRLSFPAEKSPAYRRDLSTFSVDALPQRPSEHSQSSGRIFLQRLFIYRSRND